MDFGVARGIIAKLAPRRSKVVKSSWASDALDLKLDHFSLGLSGSEKYLSASLGIV
jgi:hypothetical protein